MKTCHYCAEAIQDAAVVCKHCGRPLTAQAAQSVPRRTSPAVMLLAIVCAVVVLIIFARACVGPLP